MSGPSTSATGKKGVAVADFAQTGRGLRAQRAFTAGETILSCPSVLFWSVASAQREPVLGELLATCRPPLSIDDTIAVYLLFVRHSPSCAQPRDSPRRTHVRTGIPASYSASVFFSAADLDVCRGSSLHAVTERLRAQIADDYAALAAGLFARRPDVFPVAAGFALDDYMWALFTVWSRAMDFSTGGGGDGGDGPLRAIAPLLDMANHSFAVPQCHAYDPAAQCIKIVAGTNYKKGDQIFINYGPVSNAKLLRLYGFVVPDNPHDSYELHLSTHPLAPLYDEKLRVFAQAGLSSDAVVQLTAAEPLPATVLQYLRIQRMTLGEVTAARLTGGEVAAEQPGSRRVSVANEAEVLWALVESLEALVGGFAHSAAELERRLRDGTYAVGSDAYGAATVALGEQRILLRALDKARGLRALAACGGCGAPIDGTKRCARCGKVAYCGVECQRKEWPAHKAMCSK
ncbi:hypothetical protein DFJ73DRAFT_587145 [Zopfochytrium polystomum]|nr:hypothetical protein DFJ73DRAFT_587145 [Zopfochytrium polystomum]